MRLSDPNATRLVDDVQSRKTVNVIRFFKPLVAIDYVCPTFRIRFEELSYAVGSLL